MSFGASRLEACASAGTLAAHVNHWQSKTIGLSYCSYGAPVELSFPAATFFRQQICLAGAGETRLDRSPGPLFGRFHRTVTNEQSCILPPEASIDLALGPGYEQLVLRVEGHALTNKLAAIIGAPACRPIMFDQASGTDSSAVARLKRLITFFAGELDTRAAAAASPEIAELEQALVVAFLCNNRHNYSAALESGIPSAAPWQVRRAEEYIEAHWDQPITIEDLMEVTAASARSLFRQFKHSRGYSPMNFVREIRLRRAKEMLGAQFDRSVTETALACGFGNLGHFARSYLKRFGELPSDTARHNRSAAQGGRRARS